jgi:hypothetical protein
MTQRKAIRVYPQQYNRQAPAHEAIYEFTSRKGNGGGLVSFREGNAGDITAELYRLDESVQVKVDPARLADQEMVRRATDAAKLAEYLTSVIDEQGDDVEMYVVDILRLITEGFRSIESLRIIQAERLGSTLSGERWRIYFEDGRSAVTAPGSVKEESLLLNEEGEKMNVYFDSIGRVVKVERPPSKPFSGVA